MKLHRPEVRQEFRVKRSCEWCKVGTAGSEPAHILAKGMGGGGVIDHPFNLAALCHLCHRRQHDSNRNPSVDDLYRVVATREGVSVETVKDYLLWLRRQPKERFREFDAAAENS